MCCVLRVYLWPSPGWVTVIRRDLTPVADAGHTQVQWTRPGDIAASGRLSGLADSMPIIRPPLWSSGYTVLCFLWGTNWIYICYVEETRPPLWSRGQSSYLQIQRTRFDSRRYQISCELVGLERDPLSLMSTSEELLGRKSSGSGLENQENGCRNPSRWPCDTLYPQTLALTSPTGGGRSAGIVH
jgi:hypothetical protein